MALHLQKVFQRVLTLIQYQVNCGRDLKACFLVQESYCQEASQQGCPLFYQRLCLVKLPNCLLVWQKEA